MPSITIQQFEQFSLIVCCSTLMLYMLFVLYRLGKDSNAGRFDAGRFGMFVLFLALGLGVFGFAMKSMIHLFVI